MNFEEIKKAYEEERKKQDERRGKAARRSMVALVIAFAVLFLSMRYFYISLTTSLVIAFLVYQWQSNID